MITPILPDQLKYKKSFTTQLSDLSGFGLAKKHMERDLVQNSSFLAEIENMQEESGHPSESSAPHKDMSFEEELESLTLS